MKDSAGYKLNAGSVFKGFTFPNNLANCLQEVASTRHSGKYEADIVREALVEKLKRDYPKVASEFRVI